MKIASTKTNPTSKTAAHAAKHSVPQMDNPSQIDLIARNAYFKAEERGFAPGHELDDWLTAETEVSMTGGRP